MVSPTTDEEWQRTNHRSGEEQSSAPFFPIRGDRFRFRSLRSYLPLLSEPSSPASVAQPVQESCDTVDYEDLTYALTPIPDNQLPGLYSPKSTGLNLAATAFGAALLSLPYTLGRYGTGGPFFGLLSLLLIGGLSYSAAQAFVSAARRHGKTTYKQVVKSALGRRSGDVALLMVNLCIFIAAVSYIVGIAENLSTFVVAIEDWDRWVKILLAVALTTPAIMARDVGMFSRLSGVVCGTVSVLAVALFIQSIVTLSYDDKGINGRIGHGDIIFGFNVGTWITRSWPYQTFVFAFHYVIPSILPTLESPSTARVTQTLQSTMIYLLSPYVVIALSGWFLCFGGIGADLGPNFLQGASKEGWVVTATTWVITLTLLSTYQLFLIPLRKNIERHLNFLDKETVHDGIPLNRAVSALIWQVLVFFTAVLLKDLGIANAVAGGCIGIVMFTFPGMLIVEEVVLRRSKDAGMRRADSRYGSAPIEHDQDEDAEDGDEESLLPNSERSPTTEHLTIQQRACRVWTQTKTHFEHYDRWDYLWLTAGSLMAKFGFIVAVFGIAAVFQ